jgi:hypothetical protein
VALQEHREGGMGTSYWDAVYSPPTRSSAQSLPQSDPSGSAIALNDLR